MVPDWVALVVWGAFGVVVLSSIGVVVTQVLEAREPKEKKEPEEAPAAEVEAPADELAPVSVTADEGSGVLVHGGDADEPFDAGAMADGGAASEFEAPADSGVLPEVENHEEIANAAPDFDDFLTGFTDIKEEK